MEDQPKRMGRPPKIKANADAPLSKEFISEQNVRATHEDDQRASELIAVKAAGERMIRDGRELTDEEFRRRLEFDGGIDNIMPDPPHIEGFHTCWGSLMNEQDLHHRLDVLGYQYVKIEDAPHYRHQTSRSASIAGVISFNELVALKIPEGRQHMLAKKYHHDIPLARERTLKKEWLERADWEGKKVRITMEEGTEQLGRSPNKNPTFSV